MKGVGDQGERSDRIARDQFDKEEGDVDDEQQYYAARFRERHRLEEADGVGGAIMTTVGMDMASWLEICSKQELWEEQ